jgi:hypothetical protein
MPLVPRKVPEAVPVVHGSHLAFPDEHIEMVAEPPSRCARQLQEFTGAGTGVDSDLPLEVAPEVVVEDVMARHPPEPERQEEAERDGGDADERKNPTKIRRLFPDSIRSPHRSILRAPNLSERGAPRAHPLNCI